MAGWHHRLDGHGFKQTPGVGDGQGGLACCGSWGHKESDTTERLSWTELSGSSMEADGIGKRSEPEVNASEKQDIQFPHEDEPLRIWERFC